MRAAARCTARLHEPLSRGYTLINPRPTSFSHCYGRPLGMLAVGQLYSTNSGIGLNCEAAGYSGIEPTLANCETVAAALGFGSCMGSSPYVSRPSSCSGPGGVRGRRRSGLAMRSGLGLARVADRPPVLW